MSTVDEPRLYENENGVSPSNLGTSEQRMRIAVKSINFGSPILGLKWDSYSITRGSLVEVVEYYDGGLTGNIVATFTATFDNPRKKNIISGEWS